jgi:hypothetical protein
MAKPDLTPEQKQYFEDKFRELMSQAPEELRNQWNNKVEWHPVLHTPILGYISSKLPRPLKDKYVSLLNKLSSRDI